MPDLTKSEREFLSRALHWHNKMGWVMGTGRMYRRATGERLKRRGMLVDVEYRVCDGDGFALQPERWRSGYELTEEGKRVAEELAAEEKQRFKEMVDADA